MHPDRLKFLRHVHSELWHWREGEEHDTKLKRELTRAIRAIETEIREAGFGALFGVEEAAGSNDN